MVSDFTDADGAAISRQAAAFWRSQWTGQTLMAIGMQDPVLGPASMGQLRSTIAGCPEPLCVEKGGHFVQEHGEQVARAALDVFKDA